MRNERPDTGASRHLCTGNTALAETLVLLLVVILGGCTSPTQSREFPEPREMNLPAISFKRPDPENLRHNLGNGLGAYIVRDSSAPLVTLSAFVGTGTSEGAKEGAAESLVGDLRRGPGNMASGEFGEALYLMAAEYRVIMNAEETEITLSVGSEDTEEAIRLLAGSLRRPAIGDPASRQPLGVPEDPSMETAVAHLRNAVLGKHAYGIRPASDDYGALIRNDVAEFHQRYFVPANTVLAISGDFDSDGVISALEKEFGDWTGEPRPPRPSYPSIELSTQTRVLTFSADKLQGWVVMGHELPRVAEEDWAPLEVMNYILGGGHFDTRLFRVTRDRRGLTNDDSGFLEPATHGPGLYSFRTYGRPQVVRLLIELTLQEIAKIRSLPVSEQELFVAKGALAEGEFSMRFADGHETARTLAQEWLRYRDHSHTASYPDRIRAVTAEAVQAAAQKYLHPDRMQIVVVGPIAQIERVPAREGERKLGEMD